jgi:hypothetical protein
MAKPDMEEFMAEWTKIHGHLELPGAMLMKYGPQDYVGGAICVRGTLYFKNSFSEEVREEICKCFDAYQAIAQDHLRWLWRDEPPSGPDKFEYSKAPELRAMVKQMKPDHHLGFAYTGGEKPHDASPWRFHTSGLPAWEARLGGRGLDTLIFSVPKEVVKKNPALFQKLFVEFCRSLKAEHGHAGFALNLSIVRTEPNEPTEALMVAKMKGLDAGSAVMIAGSPDLDVENHIVNVGWLTAIRSAMVEKVGGLFTLRSELPAMWFAKYDYDNGIVIQAGPAPEIVPVELDPKPAIYVLPAMALKAIRLAEASDLHYGSKDGEPRLTGLMAEEWFNRFDVPRDELAHYKAKLLTEAKLTAATTLPDAL